MNEICFGILKFDSLENVSNLEFAINTAVQQGANSFILSANHPYISEIIKICTSFNKKTNPIAIKIISNDNSIVKNNFSNNQSIFTKITNFSTIYLDTNGLNKAESLLKISDFIIFNSYKCIGDINLETINLFHNFSYQFSMIDITTLSEICIPDVLQCDINSPMDTSNIILME